MFSGHHRNPMRGGIRFEKMEGAMISVPNSNMRSLIVASLVAAVLMCSVLGPNAQPAQSVVTDPLQGFSQDRDKPLKVEGPQSKLQLTPVIAIATYGRYNEWAKVVLGDTTIKCRFLTIHYAQ